MIGTMTWLTVKEYLCLKLLQCLCSNDNSTLSFRMTYHRICEKSNTTGATSEAGTAYHCESPGFDSGFCGFRVAQSLVFCVVFVDYCFFFLFRLAIALSVLQTFLQIVKYLLQVFLFTIGDIPLFAWFS
jgi:hypothetical protein